MIDPNNIEEIGQLQPGEVEFPLIQYDYDLQEPLQLNQTTLLAAYTNISNHVDEQYLVDLDWNSNGDIEWQNYMLQHLSESISAMILEYIEDPNENNFLLTKIFIWIQLWGGNTGRNIFVQGNGWPGNFKQKVYTKAVNEILQNQFVNALQTLNSLYGLNTAFSTKHIHFWSHADAPIYDSVIAGLVFGRNAGQVRAQEYPLYIKALDNQILYFHALGENNITRSSIERSLFNWANTPLGIQWRSLRLGIE